MRKRRAYRLERMPTLQEPLVGVSVVSRHQQGRLFGFTVARPKRFTKSVPVTTPDTLEMIEQELARLRTPLYDKPSWWEVRKRAWQEGVLDARDVQFERLCEIRERLLEEVAI